MSKLQGRGPIGARSWLAVSAYDWKQKLWAYSAAVGRWFGNGSWTKDRLDGIFLKDRLDGLMLGWNDVAMTKRDINTRDLLLSAACAILMEGQEVLTLDAVAKRSGISKGGLLHHFPSKDALVEGTVAELIRQFTLLSDRIQMESPSEAGPLGELKAYINAGLEPKLRNSTADFAQGLIRLYGSDYHKETPFLDPWRKLFSKRLSQIRQTGDLDEFAKAAVVTLVIESFVMIDVFKLIEFSDQEIAAIKRELLTRFG
ncbi:MAG: TetR/AcrR family transcriptional regulator [Holophaga sp.]|nr:TetR/AcrR family transcriptional regulator [Holophaga sp.]